MSGTKDRLAEARARAVAAQAQRDELAEATAPNQAIEAAEQEANDLEALARLEAEHGRVADGKLGVVVTRLGRVVLKPPHRVKFRQFADVKEPNSDDIEGLVRPCIVHPGGPAFDAILDQLPAVLTLCGNAVTRLAGIDDKALAGK
jgi:hypothetical protein